ncbi:SWI/SNF-related matrix-associated actin-dependent regulator of chromatin subfamily A-like protein 1 [Mactra antiquata]
MQRLHFLSNSHQTGFGIQQNGRVLIADDMGLGKTIQAICLAYYYRNDWPLLVVVPSSVRFDWAQNFQRWVPSLDPQCINTVVSGKDSCTTGLINILSYDLMARKANNLKDKRFQVVIMDECHFLKNYKTARCKAALPLLQNAKRVILLSGTPALSRPLELFTQINAVCPYLFKFHDFGMRYCDGKQMPWGPDYSGSSNMEELQILLEQSIMIRRLKTDVLTELPEKIRQMIMLDPSLIQISRELKTACKVMNSGNLKKMEQHGALLDFFHKSGSAKMKAIKSYVDDILESDKKFLIFAHHSDVLDGIEEIVRNKIEGNYIRIDGKSGSEQRNFLCKKFQHNDTVRVAILSITAANAGLNLSSASMVIFAELFWNPGILVQAEDRAHRIGQQDMVCVQYLVATGTSDDHIWPMIQRKLDVLGKAGLTKDNFSSAETTRLKDSRQEEIMKFLEESLLEDTFSDEMIEDSSPTKSAVKQQSILKYTSPLTKCKTSSQERISPIKKSTKQKQLFQYFSPKKEKEAKSVNDGKNMSTITENVSEQSHGHCLTSEGQGQINVGQVYDKDELDIMFEDFDDFSDDSMDDIDVDNLKPCVKKRKV